MTALTDITEEKDVPLRKKRQSKPKRTLSDEPSTSTCTTKPGRPPAPTRKGTLGVRIADKKTVKGYRQLQSVLGDGQTISLQMPLDISYDNLLHHMIQKVFPDGKNDFVGNIEQYQTSLVNASNIVLNQNIDAFTLRKYVEMKMLGESGTVRIHLLLSDESPDEPQYQNLTPSGQVQLRVKNPSGPIPFDTSVQQSPSNIPNTSNAFCLPDLPEAINFTNSPHMYQTQCLVQSLLSEEPNNLVDYLQSDDNSIALPEVFSSDPVGNMEMEPHDKEPNLSPHDLYAGSQQSSDNASVPAANLNSLLQVEHNKNECPNTLKDVLEVFATEINSEGDGKKNIINVCR